MSISPIKILFIFYVLAMSDYSENMMSNQMKEYIKNNRLVQHIIGILTMIMLITIVTDVSDTRTVVIYSLILYTCYILSTKLDIYWNIIIIILLFVGYMYENSQHKKELDIMSDQSLTDEQKTKMIDDANKYKIWLSGAILLIIIVGTFLYSQKKQIQYGGGYDFFEYILG